MILPALKLLSLSVALACSTAIAAPKPFQTEGDKSSKDAAAKDTEKKEEKKSEEKPETSSEADSNILAIVGGDIITVTRETIRNGIILIEDGEIKAVGRKVEIPENAKRIDATGMTITPGFVALNMSGVGLNASSDSKEKYEDALDPFDRNISLCLGVGITTGCIEVSGSRGGGRRNYPTDSFPITERFLGFDPDPSALEGMKSETERDYGEAISLCPCCGLPILPTEPISTPAPTPITPRDNAVIKMSFGKLDGMLVAESVFMDLTPGSLTGALNQHTWRKQLQQARDYIKAQAEHEKATAAGKKQQPPRKPVPDGIINLVKGEVALRISANSKSAITEQVLLAKELDYDIVIEGGSEAWTVVDELSSVSAGVVYTPRRRSDPQFGEEKTSGTWVETPRVLQDSGVPFALAALSNSISLNGLAGRDLTSLPLEAAFAVRGGASERTALAALTIVPAKMMGLDDRIGSIEVGKDADLLILNGNPLDYRTYVETAVVDGRVVYERSVEKVLPVYE